MKRTIGNRQLKIKTVVALVVLLCTTLSAQKNVADTLDPLRVVQKYVSGEPFPGKMKHFCGEEAAEMRTDSTLGMILPARIKRECELVFQDSTHAGVAVWLRDSSITRDIYFYLIKDRTWQVFAIRTLTNMDLLEKEIDSLEKVPGEKRKKFITASGYTWQFEYDNLALWISSDNQLETNFKYCKKDLVNLQKQLVKCGYYGKNDSLVNTAMKNKKVAKKAVNLLLRNIRSSKKYPGCVFYIIGGVKDNSVGYMYQPDPAKVPLMTEKHFILMKSLGEGWYLFKTT